MIQIVSYVLHAYPIPNIVVICHTIPTPHTSSLRPFTPLRKRMKSVLSHITSPFATEPASMKLNGPLTSMMYNSSLLQSSKSSMTKRVRRRRE